MEEAPRDEKIEWALTAQTLLVVLFIFLFYLKGQNSQHLHTILTGSIFIYDYKKYQQRKTKWSLASLLFWLLLFVFSLITTLQMIASL